MEKLKFGLQLFSVRDFMTTAEDIYETFTKLKKMGYDQIQTAGCAIPYAEYGKIARETGLEIIGTHDSFKMMVEDFEQSLENHKLLGTTNMGIGGMSYKILDDVKRFIEKANIVAEKAAKNNMKLTYHNHAHEFFRWENKKTTMEMLVEELNPNGTSFVLDTYWVQYGGGAINEWIKNLTGRIDIIHLKDMMVGLDDGRATPHITEIGNGNFDWNGIIKTAQEAKVKYYVVEQDCGWNPNCFASVKKSIEYLRALN